MVHIPFSETERVDSKEGTIWDYFISKEIGVSYQELHARGPESGQYLNTECHEIYFVVEGSAQFSINGEEYTVNEKDIVVVEPNTPHHIKTNNLRYITITRPDWFPEQYKHTV
jgi:mannose-6-phosphate isomerase-like protein (cupin superfamily)